MQDQHSNALPIAAVERDTGLSKDVLRVWERRYGFPEPVRDGKGDRLYPLDQVERLHLIKQLLDRGFRPNRVVPLAAEELQRLVEQQPRRAEPAPDGAFVQLLRAGDPASVGAHLRQRLAVEGLRRFVAETLSGANQTVGEAWRRGEIAVHEEHLYSEQVHAVLRAAFAALPAAGGRPRVLLTTLPGELHSLGLLMVEALLRIDGAEVLPFGPQMPLAEITAAAGKHAADVVALSFSAGFPAAPALEMLGGLRRQLPASTEIWIGGRGAPSRGERLGDAVRLVPLEALADALADWRRRRAS